MFRTICNVCNKKINLFSKIFSIKCNNCGDKLHMTCGINVLDHTSYTKNEIVYLENYCKNCADSNSKYFGDDRYCKICNDDISRSKKAKNCEICNKIGHGQCFGKNALIVNSELSLIYPYLHEINMHNYICPSCLENLNDKIHYVKSRIPEWVGGTRYEYIKGAKTLKNIGRIEYNGKKCSEPDDVENILMFRAIQVGGNAFVKFYWEKHSKRYSEEYLAGYSENNNPYYRTRYWTKKWFTGYAFAVVVEQNFDKYRNSESINQKYASVINTN